jgi:biotin carboxyl carrier protein
MRSFKVLVNKVAYAVEVQEEGVYDVAALAAAPAPERPKAAAAFLAAPPAAARAKAAAAAPAEIAAGDIPLKAPMPGTITKLMAKAGQSIKRGDVLMLLEAMKMQNEIGAPSAGTVKSVHVSLGEIVKPGQLMAVISR